jgi:RNA polymerase sigma-70 factor (ECF subfamily)
VPEPGVLGTDEQLVAAIVAGNLDRFTVWLAGAEGRLRASLRPFARQVDVEAVLQEALVRVWQMAPRFVPDGRPDGLLRFAIRIARNLAISALRRQRLDLVDAATLERVAADADLLAPPPDRASDPLLGRAIEDCRRQLPDKPARALIARIENAGADPDARVAERVGMRPNTFFQNIIRARKFLAECLRKRGIDLTMELS